MDLSVTLAAMLDAGCTREQMLAVVQAHEAIEEKKLTEKRASFRPTQPFVSNWVHPRLCGKEWLKIRDRIMERDGFVCAYCEETIGPWCVDHIVPLCRGGSNEDDNLTVACSDCNSSKSTQLLSEWRRRP